MFAFCSLLVYLKIFDQVELSFLPVGHTHEDVDQMFSTLQAGAKKHNFFNMQQLYDFITASFPAQATCPSPVLVDSVCFIFK